MHGANNSQGMSSEQRVWEAGGSGGDVWGLEDQDTCWVEWDKTEKCVGWAGSCAVWQWGSGRL